MSPKNSGAPKKPRWSQAKKAAARRGDAAPRPTRKPVRRTDDVDARRGGPDRREERASYPGRRDDRWNDRRSEGGRRFESDRRGRPAGRGSSRYEDVDGGWVAGRSERRDERNTDRRDERGFDRGGRGFDRDDRHQRRDDRRFEKRDDRGHGRREQRDDRYQRRDDRFERRDDRGRGFDRNHRSDDRGFDRGARRDDRYQRRDDRGFDRRDDRGRGFDRDHRNDDRGGDRYGRPQRDDRYPRQDRFSRDERYPRRDDRRDDRGRGDHGPVADAPRREHLPAPADAPTVRADQLRRKEVVAEPVDLTTNGFALLGVPEPMVRRLARDGITTPFPIQEATIPDALAGRDVLGRGRTGSGKTLAFGLPLLARLAEGEKASPNKPRAIVLSPTRELAMQISDALQPLVHVMGLRHKLVAGGMPYPPQFDALDRGVDVLIATPGRLSDLIERGACTLEGCEIVVLDEADHMADMGFLPEVTELMDQVPAGGQRLLFSATLDKGIDTLVEAYLTDPVTHSTDEAQASVTTMAHHVLLVEPAHKKVVTAHVANRGGHTIVFVRTKLGADRVAMQLREQGVFAAALHGGLSQAARNRVLAGFKDGTLPVLVATDVAARGIHVDDVGVVLQVDPPADHKDYLHRAGRTARAGENGTVVTLALPHQKRMMQRIAEQAGVDVTPEKLAPGDARLHEITGASRPDAAPIPEERLRRLMEPPPRPRRGGYRQGGGGGGRGGYRGSRDGGSRGRYRD